MNPKLETCEECGRAGYNHKRLGLLVDGLLKVETLVCRPCAVDKEKAIINELIPAHHAQKR